MEFYFSLCPHGAFSVSDADKLHWWPVTLPGDSIRHLSENGLEKCMPEYFDNSRRFFKYEVMDFIYRSSFDGDSGMAYRFCCDGLDTIADIYLNGAKIYESRTAFVRLDLPFDVVNDGENELLVHFIAPTEFIKNKRDDFEKKSLNVLFDEKWRAYLRKPQWHYGWDNAPHLAGVGFIGMPRLLAIKSPLHLVDLVFDQDYDWRQHSVDFKFRITAAVYRQCQITLQLQYGGKMVWESQPCNLNCGKYELQPLPGGCLESVKEWNCVGYGKPHLYTLQVLCNSEVVYRTEIGFRTIELSRRPIGSRRLDYRIGQPNVQNDELLMDGGAEAVECRNGLLINGAWSRIPVEEYEVKIEDFCLELNGKRVFIEGFDWQPLEYNLSNVDSGKLADALAKMAALQVNSVRIWGGAYVEGDDFYRFCDHNGIIVWQDFQFACSLYPERDRYFRSLVRQEVTDIFKRLANHPSLGIFCGSNEIDMILFDRGLDCKRENSIGYELIPGILKELQCIVPYHVSSPAGSEYPRFPFSGECRNWSTMTHIADDYPALRADESIMVSEGGCAAYPNRELCEKFIRPEWPLHEDFLLEHEAYRVHAMSTYFHQNRIKPQNIHQAIRKYFGQWGNLDELIYLSQLYQSRGLRRYSEVFRYKQQTMRGYYIWKFADSWPCLSLSVLDYHNQPKMAWYVLKRALGELTIAPFSEVNGYRFSIFSRLPTATAELSIRVDELGGGTMVEIVKELSTLRQGINHNSVVIDRARLHDSSPERTVIIARLRQGDKLVYERIFFIVTLNELELDYRPLRVTLTACGAGDGNWHYQLIIRADCLTVGINIRPVGTVGNLSFSDNAFDLMPGTDRIIEITTVRPLSDHELLLESYNQLRFHRQPLKLKIVR